MTVERAEAERREWVAQVLERLRERYPRVGYLLNADSPLQWLVATILAAQCTDERVNAIVPGLFARYPTAAAFAAAPQADLEEVVRPTGFYRNKARSIQGACRMIVEEYGGQVPRAMPDLLRLPGVARKTANVVLGNAFGIVEGVIVDTHVGRVSRRLGFTAQQDPERVEVELMALLPRAEWLDTAQRLIVHGRALCKAQRPLCDRCFLAALCPFPKAAGQ